MDPPAHFQEHLEALGAAGGNGEVKIVASNPIDNGRGADILVQGRRKEEEGCVCLVGEGRRGEAIKQSGDQLASTQQYFRQLLLLAAGS